MGRRRRGRSRPAAPILALFAAVALVAGCTVRVRPEPPPTSRAAGAATSTTPGPAIRGTTLASRAFTLERGWPEGRVRPARSGALPLAMRRSDSSEDQDETVNLLLVFPLLRTPPRCVRQVDLWLRVLRFDHQFRHQEPQIGAYPSKLVSLASGRPATRIGFETLIDNRPTGTGYLTPDDAWMHFDITELYRTWAEGGPFPSALGTVPEGPRWSWTSGRRTAASPGSRPGSPLSATGRSPPSYGGRRPGTAEPAGW